MNRREEIEKELDITQNRIDAAENTPEEQVEGWHSELESLGTELDTLKEKDQQQFHQDYF